jgi:hypothetical protein
MDAGRSFSEVRSFHRSNATFSATHVNDEVAGEPLVYKPQNTELIWDFEKSNLKSLRDVDNSELGSMIITKRKKFRGTVSGTGTVTFKASSGEYFKPMGAGSIAVVWAAGVNASIRLTSTNTTFTPEQVTFNLTGHAGKNVAAILDVISSNVTEKTKTVTMHAQSFAGSTSQSYTLSKSDVISIRAWATSTPADANRLGWVDVTDHFILFNGQQDDRYVNATITRNSVNGYPVGKTHLVVDIEYFHHSGTAGFFTVDSYSTYDYASIPVHRCANGKTYRLESSIDFRPLVLGGVVDSQSTLPSVDSTCVFDATYYLPRVDSVCARKNGSFVVVKGTSGDTPAPPVLEEDHLVLYNIYLPAYTRNLNEVIVKYQDNRRYTMSDIARIDSRLSNVEYYVSLSLLEKSAADFEIKDVNGLDRFKNGFVVDNFQDFQAADIADGEFKASIDPNRRELRPSFKSRNTKFVVNKAESYGVHFIDSMAYLPYDDMLLKKQEAATGAISINPYFVYTKRGKMVLKPNIDTWCDTTTVEPFSVTLDTGTTETLQALGGVGGQQLGQWTEFNRTIANVDVDVDTTTSFQNNAGTSVSSTAPR